MISDTLTEQSTTGQASTYYRAQVRLDPKTAKANSKLADVALKAGITATVNIRTVLKYLASPYLRLSAGLLTHATQI